VAFLISIGFSVAQSKPVSPETCNHKNNGNSRTCGLQQAPRGRHDVKVASPNRRLTHHPVPFSVYGTLPGVTRIPFPAYKNLGWGESLLKRLQEEMSPARPWLKATCKEGFCPPRRGETKRARVLTDAEIAQN
jgi:hypothetical protein